MKKWMLPALIMLILTGCGSAAPAPVIQPTETAQTTEQETTDMIQLTIGEETVHAELADNAAAKELSRLLQKGPITMSASNYGGFEKVCALGTCLPTADVQTATRAGDIMLYSGNQIVIFYGSNSWAYTRLAKVAEEEIPKLESILSGSETEVTIALAEQ